MKASELRNLTLQELTQKHNSLQEEVFNLRIEMKAGRIEKPHKLKELKRDIARIKTIIKELSHSTSPPSDGAPPGLSSAQIKKGNLINNK